MAENSLKGSIGMTISYRMRAKVQNMMQRIFVTLLALSSSLALAQGTPDIPPQGNERVVIVPMDGSPYDAGFQAPPPEPQAEPITNDIPLQPPPTRTIEALPPAPVEPQTYDVNPTPTLPPEGPGAMLDGHPREGAFLSGPGSFTFIMHHTLMTGLGVLATQMIPRAVDSSAPHSSLRDPAIIDGCTDSRLAAIRKDTPSITNCTEVFSGESARVAYLTGSLVGAAIGFGTAAAWQFFNWQSHRAANFGIISSFFGAAFLGSIADLATMSGDPTAITWLTLIGASAGAWTATIIGGGDISLNKAALITTGGAWAAIYTALITAIVATTGSNITGRTAVDITMLTPAIGAALFALAGLKFNPSFGQIMRANLFGALAGAVVLVASALIVNPVTGWGTPYPYAFGLGAAALAQGLVSWLWADAAESKPTTWLTGYTHDGRYVGVW